MRPYGPLLYGPVRYTRPLLTQNGLLPTPAATFAWPISEPAGHSSLSAAVLEHWTASLTRASRPLGAVTDRPRNSSSSSVRLSDRRNGLLEPAAGRSTPA